MTPRMLRIGALAFALAATFGNARAQDAQDAQEATPETAPPPALDEQARNAAMDGRNADALRLIDEFLASNPGDRAALLDRARYLGWRGDYAAAMDTLAKLPQDDVDANNLRARTLAWAERRHQAVAINAPLYAETPDDYDTAWTEALAHKLGAWPQEALPALATVQRIKPDDQDSRDLAKVVRVPLFSSVSMPFSRYSDSDDIEIRNWPSAQLDLRLSDQWRLLADYTRRELSAPAAGPFAPATGGDSVDEDRIGVGLRFAASPYTTVEGWAGRSSLDPGGSVGTARLAVSTEPNDDWAFGFSADRDRVDESPRAISLDLVRNGFGANARWTPTLRDTLSLQANADRYSDDNRRFAMLAEYRRAIWRGDRVMFDLGAQAEYMSFSDRDLADGYYAPESYRRFAPIASAYFNLGTDVGLYVAVAEGMQRDETFDGWKRASDVSAELTLGIFTHWQLVASAGHSQRLNQFGRYEGTSFGLSLRYRFCEFRADRCPKP